MMEPPDSPTSDIPVWLDGTQRWVTGLTKRTTCDDVIYALLYSNGLHETESTDNYAIFEKWREVERPLSARTKLFKVWNFWGHEQPNVQLSMRSVDEYFFPGESSLYLRSRRRHKRSSRIKSRHSSHGRCPVRRGCVECTRLKSLEQLVKLVVCQERKIKDLQDRIHHTDRLVHTHETKIHQHRVEHNGLDYVQNSYLNSQSSSSSSSIDSSVFTTIDLKKVKAIFPDSSWQDLEDIMRMCEDIADIDKRKAEEVAKLNQQLQEVEKLKQDGTNGLAMLQETNAELEETRVDMVRAVTAHITHEYSEKEQDYKMSVLEQQIQAGQQLMLDLQKQLSEIEQMEEHDDDDTTIPATAYNDYHQPHNQSSHHTYNQRQQQQQQKTHLPYPTTNQHRFGHQSLHLQQHQHENDYQRQNQIQQPHHQQQQHQHTTRYNHHQRIPGHKQHPNHNGIPSGSTPNPTHTNYNQKEDRSPHYPQHQPIDRTNNAIQTPNPSCGFIPVANSLNEIHLRGRASSPYLNQTASRSRSKSRGDSRDLQTRSNSVGRSKSEERLRVQSETSELGHISKTRNSENCNRNETNENTFDTRVVYMNGLNSITVASTDDILVGRKQFVNSSRIPVIRDLDLGNRLHSASGENSTGDCRAFPPKPKPRGTRMKQGHHWYEQPDSDKISQQQSSNNVLLTHGSNGEHVNSTTEFNQMCKRRGGGRFSSNTDLEQRDTVSSQHERVEGYYHPRVPDYRSCPSGDHDEIARSGSSRIMEKGYEGDSNTFHQMSNVPRGIDGYPSQLETNRMNGESERGREYYSRNVNNVNSHGDSSPQSNHLNMPLVTSSSTSNPNHNGDDRTDSVTNSGNLVLTKINDTGSANSSHPPDIFKTSGLATNTNGREGGGNNQIQGHPTKMMARFPRSHYQNGNDHPPSLSVKPSQSPVHDSVTGNTSSFTSGILQTYDRTTNINPSVSRKDNNLVSSPSTSLSHPHNSPTSLRNDNNNNNGNTDTNPASNRGALYHIISDKLNKSKQSTNKSPLVQQPASQDSTQDKHQTKDDSEQSRSPIYCSSTSSSSTTINAYLSSDETNSSVCKVSSGEDGKKPSQISKDRNLVNSIPMSQNSHRDQVNKSHFVTTSKSNEMDDVQRKIPNQNRGTNSNYLSYTDKVRNMDSPKLMENKISNQQSNVNGKSDFQTERAPLTSHPVINNTQQTKSPASRRRGINPHFCDITKDPKPPPPTNTNKKPPISERKQDQKTSFAFQGADGYQNSYSYTVISGEEFGNRHINFAALAFNDSEKYNSDKKIDVKTILDKRQLEQSSHDSKYYSPKGVTATNSRTGGNNSNILLGKNKMEDSNDSNSDTGLSSMHSDETANMETLV